MTRRLLGYTDVGLKSADLELRLPVLPHDYHTGSGSITDGLTDARAALVDAQNAAGGRRIKFTPGQYRVASNWTPSAGTVFEFDTNAFLVPDTGVTIDLTDCTVVDGLTKIFHVASDAAATGGTVTGFLRNDVIRPEWWGATSVRNESINDDASALRNRVALRQAVAACNDNEIRLRGIYTIDQAVTFTGVTASGRSGGINGCGATRSGFKGKTTAPNFTLLDVTDINGPDWHFEDFQCTGPAPGSVAGTGVSGVANGVGFSNVWFRGLQFGAIVQGSYNSYDHCIWEFCGLALSFDTNSSEEGDFSHLSFFRNGVDIRATNIDMRGTLFSDITHINTGQGISFPNVGDCWDLRGVSNLQVRGVVHNYSDEATNLANTVHLSLGCVSVRFSGVQGSGGATTVFMENCVDCSVDDWTSDNAQNGLWITNPQTAHNNVSNFKIRGSTAYGMNVDVVDAPGNVIRNGDVIGCARQMRIATETVEFRDIKFRDGVAAGPLVVAGSGLTFVRAHNVTWDVPGTWVSTLDGTPDAITAIYDVDPGGAKIVVGAGAPTVGTWAVRDTILIAAPAAGGYAKKICVVAGTPGTWKDAEPIET